MGRREAEDEGAAAGGGDALSVLDCAGGDGAAPLGVCVDCAELRGVRTWSMVFLRE